MSGMKLRYLLCFLVILLLIIAIVIVSVVKSPYMAERYLEDKYDEVFSFVSSGEQSGVRSFVFTSENSDKDFIVKQGAPGLKNSEYCDNYYAELRMLDYKRLIEDKAFDNFARCKVCVSFENDFYDASWNKNTPLEQALRERPEYFKSKIGVFVDEDVSDDSLKAFLSEFTEPYWDAEVFICNFASGNIAGFRDDNFLTSISECRYTDRYLGSWILKDGHIKQGK